MILLMKKSASVIKAFKWMAPAICIISLISSCKQQKEDFPYPDTLDKYMPLAVGKSFTYRLDSTIPAIDAKSLVVHRYLVKDTIDAIVNDAQGRPSYRIRRFITDSLGAGPWIDNTTFLATPVSTPSLGASIEFVDNNLRFIKLKTPLKDGFTWKGNSYINTTPGYTNLYYLDDWDYTYQDMGTAATIGTNSYDDVATVLQHPDEGGNANLQDPNVTNDQRIYSIEKYASGIGLVYKEFIFWEFQRDPADAERYYFQDYSYGVKLTLIKHN